jgi:hypothetical protein
MQKCLVVIRLREIVTAHVVITFATPCKQRISKSRVHVSYTIVKLHDHSYSSYYSVS